MAGQEKQRMVRVPQRERPWRIGVVDYHKNQCRGGHGVHLAFAGLPGVEIAAVADPDEQSRHQLQRETGAKNTYADGRELLEREKPDVVCVCSRLPTQHLDMILAAAEAGCHILSEKPLAATLADADSMIAAADGAGVRLAVAHLGRYAEAFRTARTMIGRGDIGRPLTVWCRGKEDERGGGEDMLVLGSHLLDLEAFFFGPPQWVFGHVTTAGQAINRADAQAPTEPVGAVAGEEIVALYGFAEGVRGHFESRRDLYDGGEPRMAITVIGTEATLSFRYDDRRRLRIRRSRRPLEEGGEYEDVATPAPPEVAGAEPLAKYVSAPTGMRLYFANGNRQAAVDLLDAAVSGRAPMASGDDARWALEMIHGVYVSHLWGRAVALPLEQRGHPLE